MQQTRFADGTVVTVDFNRRTVETCTELRTGNGTVMVSDVGAQAASWKPAALGGKEAFFMAADRPWGEEVHGGVPICWPWFGGRGAPPSHGIVRYVQWRPEGGAHAGPGPQALSFAV